MPLMQTIRLWWTMVARELQLAWRNRLDVATGWMFFIVVVSLLPLAINPRPELLREMGPAVLMVSGLLANVLTLNRLFEQDWADGSLAQLLLLPISGSGVVFAKIVAHWLSIGVPMALIAPVLAMQYQLPVAQIARLSAVIVLVMAILSAMGAMSAALTLGLRQGGMLLSLLHLPLCVPILVFGTQAVLNTYGFAEWWLLAALWLGAWFFAPFVAASALRLALQ